MNDIVKNDNHISSSMIEVISKAASNPEVDIHKMEKLLDMQERIMNKQSEMQFNSAVAQMQNDIPVISENGEIKVNGVVRSKYATFDDILKASKPVMKEHGLAVTFKVDTSEGFVKVVGILMHVSGHREETTMTLPFDNSGSKNNVQAMGSSISYGKRYVICAMLNIATGDDNDGQGNTTINPQQAMLITKKVTELKESFPEIEKTVLDHAGVDSIHLIPSSMFDEISTRLNATGNK